MLNALRLTYRDLEDKMINSRRRILLFVYGIFCLLSMVITACDTPGEGAQTEVETPTLTDPAAEQPTTDAPAPAEAAAPAADAVLLCDDDAGTHLWHFAAGPQRWEKHTVESLLSPGFIAQGLVPLADNGGVLIYGVRVDEASNARFQAYLWQDGAVRQAADEAEAYAVAPQLGAEERHSALYATRADDPGTLYRLDVAQCRDGDCAFAPVNRLTFDSPNGDRAVVWNIADQTLQLSQAAEQNGEILDTGGSPFWLDAQTMGYLRLPAAATEMNDAQPALMLTGVDGDTEPQVLFTAEQAGELLLAQGVIDETADLILYNATATPAHAAVVLVSAVDRNAPERTFLFEVQRETGEAQYAPAFTALSLAGAAWTPGGRFLAARSADELQLYAPASGEVTRYPLSGVSEMVRGYAFSADGAWLLVPNGATTYLAQPGSAEMAEINLAGQYCTLAAWLDE